LVPTGLTLFLVLALAALVLSAALTAPSAITREPIQQQR
jgi:hypothetical protein